MSSNEELYDDQYYLTLPVDSDRIEMLLRHFNLTANDTVCEIGCAAGHFLAEIAGSIHSGIGIDTAEAAISAANKRRDENGLDNIRFQQVAAQDFASDDQNVEQFSYVLLMDVTEHIDDQILAEVLLAASKLLKPDGRLIIHTPNLSYWLERLKDRGIVKQIYGHIAVRNRSQYLQALSNAGFEQNAAIGLAHYRQPLRTVDLVLKWIPWIGRLFQARLFIVSQKTS
jgi:2-polyprenyl-6-hydroxyphenyl methylase/3-demethylubiquinone-9 3-methyltransferase